MLIMSFAYKINKNKLGSHLKIFAWVTVTMIEWIIATYHEPNFLENDILRPHYNLEGGDGSRVPTLVKLLTIWLDICKFYILLTLKGQCKPHGLGIILGWFTWDPKS